MKITNKKILITGGATGIGFGLAEQFIKDGNTVIICGRKETSLQEASIKLNGLLTHSCDLADARDRIALYEWVSENHSDLNVLVNNAGIQQWMSISDVDFYDRARAELAINVEAPVHLSSLFIKLNSLDTIMNVTSGLSFVPLIKTPVYSATKAFFHSFTLSLRKLLKEKSIDVIEIIPPALNTDLGGKGLHDYAPPVKDFIESIFSQMNENKKTLTFGFSDTVSKANVVELQQTFDKMNNVSV